jgi:hypothetical protein
MTTPTFPLCRPAWASPHGGDGLVAAQDATANAFWADVILAVHERLAVLWTSVGAQPEEIGRQALQRPGVRAVTLMPASEDTGYTLVGLRFAAHLAAQRSHSGLAYRPCLTSWSTPDPPGGWLRLPHLLSVDNGARIHDLVIWELVDAAHAAEWLGRPLPDLAFIEAHLPTLCRLRTAARTGRLPATHAGQRLAGLLDHRPLSMRLVFEHLDLIRLLILQTALTDGAAAG